MAAMAARFCDQASSFSSFVNSISPLCGHHTSVLTPALHSSRTHAGRSGGGLRLAVCLGSSAADAGPAHQPSLCRLGYQYSLSRVEGKIQHCKGLHGMRGRAHSASHRCASLPCGSIHSLGLLSRSTRKYFRTWQPPCSKKIETDTQPSGRI